jgi:dihydromethanopterin reductase (acceptor)
MKNIAWGITGAGHYLSESMDAMQKVSKENRVCTFVSQAGEEVLKMYGLFSELSMVSRGEYLTEIFLESEEGNSSPKTGRFMTGAFDLLIIAPATANTVAKIANGIADSIVTNAAALSNKAGIPVYVLPTETEKGTYTRTPFIIDRMLCQHCQVCKPQGRCPNRAIHDQIDLLKCNGCGICIELCEYGAIRSKTIQIVRRELDRKNIEKLKDLPGFFLLENAEEIINLFYP